MWTRKLPPKTSTSKVTQSGALSIDLDSETLDIAATTGIDTGGSGNTLTVAIDSTVATLTGSQTLTNKTLTTPVISIH